MNEPLYTKKDIGRAALAMGLGPVWVVMVFSALSHEHGPEPWSRAVIEPLIRPTVSKRDRFFRLATPKGSST